MIGQPAGSFFWLWCHEGYGRTTVLRELRAELGGALLGCAAFFEVADARHPLSLEEAMARVLLSALDEHPVVIVDDWHVMSAVFTRCGAYPQTGFLDVPLDAVVAKAAPGAAGR